MLFNARNARVSLGDAKMEYAAFGCGERALVLLPGLSDGLATVKGKALLLAWPYRRFLKRWTLYMFSRKDPLPEGCSIRDMAADQAAAMKALGIDRACVMGVSQGGMIAQYLAIDHPEMVEKLVIAVSAPRSNPVARERVGAWMEYARQGDHRRLMIDTAEHSYSQGYLRKYRRLYPLIGCVGRPGDYRRFLVNAAAILAFDAREALGDIRCPTLIIGGEDDRIVGVGASHELHGLIPGSALHIYPGLGHAAYEEAGDFNDRVFRFLGSQDQDAQYRFND